MRKIIFESAVSMDGFIEGPNGELDWLIFEQDARAFLSRFDTIFYGRKAYEKFGVPNDSESDVRRRFLDSVNNMRKYVFSRIEKHLPGNGMIVSDNIEAEVRQIRAEQGKCIWFCGGAEMLGTFSELDLIDEYVFAVHPVTLRSGKPVFAGIRRPLKLWLLDIENFRSGVTKLRYLPESRVNK